MNFRRPVALVLLWLPTLSAGAAPPACVSVEEASRMLNKDICVVAHIYDVVELEDGSRFLDVCPPELPDEACRFTILSLPEDRAEVGELNRYLNLDVHVRGTVRHFRERAGLLLNDRRQFRGEPPRFRPNPMLAQGFDASKDRPAVRAPNLRSQGGRRSFMNNRAQRQRPTP